MKPANPLPTSLLIMFFKNAMFAPVSNSQPRESFEPSSGHGSLPTACLSLLFSPFPSPYLSLLASREGPWSPGDLRSPPTALADHHRPFLSSPPLSLHLFPSPLLCIHQHSDSKAQITLDSHWYGLTRLEPSDSGRFGKPSFIAILVQETI